MRIKNKPPHAYAHGGEDRYNAQYSRNSAGVRILGCLIPDSKKSLSPVSRISAFAMIAALNIGLSLISRICDSKDISSVGVGTNSSDSNAMERLTIKSQEVGKKKFPYR